MHDKIALIEQMRSKLKLGGPNGDIEKLHKTGRLTARERLAVLLDEGSFIEVEMFCRPVQTGIESTEVSIRGDGLICGYGEVAGKPICVWAQDASILKGKEGIVHYSKMIRILERALKARVPCVGIIDSIGIRVEEMQSVPSNYSYDRYLYLQSVASGVIPQISLVMGPCVGAAAISSQMSDFLFTVRNTSYVSLREPINTHGEINHDLGLSSDYGTQSCDVIANGDEDCISKVKSLLAYLPSNNSETTPSMETGDDPLREVPEIINIIPNNSKKAYDIHDVISRIVDCSTFFELKKHWAANLVVGFARFGGRCAGIVANNPRVMGGCLDVDSSDKLARFVIFCDAFQIPLVYLADTPAFLPSIEQEHRGIIRHGAKTIFANSTALVPQIQIYLRKCYGGGNLAMPGNNLGGDFGLLWPGAELLLMHPEGAVAIIHRKNISSSPNPKAEFERRLEEFKDTVKVGNIWEALTVQDYIHPKDTRKKIIHMIKLLQNKTEKRYFSRHDNMPL